MQSKETFIKWLYNFDSLILQNEAEVETKFIIPMFQHLGYPDDHRRDKFPLKVYNPGRQGRKPEIDLIYFSVNAPEDQNTHTSLVVVEAKEPQRVNLEEDLAQAKFYSYYLKAPFILVTNGYNIKVLKQHTYHEEIICDDTMEGMKDSSKAALLYEQLNFQSVRRVKEEGVSLSEAISVDDFPPPLALHFHGREEELAKLKDAAGHNTIIVIGGIAGIGKTYLAAQLVRELKNSYPVLWLTFEVHTHLEQYIFRLAHYFQNTFDDSALLHMVRTQNKSGDQHLKLATSLLNKGLMKLSTS
jgi:hypothetical protein